ncbi:hypothetical protein GCM10022223_42780 [Kineosporia mesophila]|uniref:TetR family transcriptional regulator n=1 Tax=Kineosporia mesophila TaxID=566012 RepID=A0ABP6ZWB0_9ACTN|nr:hypothetical protein [Kineosporia mesophila]MCD5353282.1 hypothetical protein [Kineosporia mesophila]
MLPGDVLASGELTATGVGEQDVQPLAAGCLSIRGGLAGDPQEFLAASRRTGEQALAERLARAVDEGDLPPGTDTSSMARYVMVVSEGNAVHASTGATREQLHATVDWALKALSSS